MAHLWYSTSAIDAFEAMDSILDVPTLTMRETMATDATSPAIDCPCARSRARKPARTASVDLSLDRARKVSTSSPSLLAEHTA